MSIESTVISCDILVRQLKHLPGQHNQLDHGRRFGKPNANTSWNKMSDEERRNDLVSKYKNWEKGLSQEEGKAIYGYTGSDYVLINKRLRNGSSFGKTEDKNIDNKIKAVQDGLLKGKTPYAFTVSRNIGFADAAKGDAFWQEIQKNKGKVFTDKGFVSTTSNEKGVFGGKVQMTIHIPKNAPGGYVDNFSEIKGENEFLLPHGSKFKVLSFKEENGKRYVELGVATR